MQITDIEQELLRLLVKNSRWGLSILSHLMGKSRNWVSRTIRRLVEKGVIRAYLTVFDPSQLYSERSTLLLVKTNPRETNVSQGLLELPELQFLDGITGDYSLLGHFRKRDRTGYEDLLDRVDTLIARSGEGKFKLIQVLTTYKSHSFAITSKASQEAILTGTDLELMQVLSRYAPTPDNPLPLSQKEIGSRMQNSLSQPAISKAMIRLEQRNAIVGHSVDIDFADINLPTKFFLQVKPKPGTVAETAQRVSDMNEVWDLYRISEDYSLFATVRTDSVKSYNRFLKGLYEDENILDTQSQISLEEWFIPIHTKFG